MAPDQTIEDLAPEDDPPGLGAFVKGPNLAMFSVMEGVFDEVVSREETPIYTLMFAGALAPNFFERSAAQFEGIAGGPSRGARVQSGSPDKPKRSVD